MNRRRRGNGGTAAAQQSSNDDGAASPGESHLLLPKHQPRNHVMKQENAMDVVTARANGEAAVADYQGNRVQQAAGHIAMVLHAAYREAGNKHPEMGPETQVGIQATNRNIIMFSQNGSSERKQRKNPSWLDEKDGRIGWLEDLAAMKIDDEDSDGKGGVKGGDVSDTAMVKRAALKLLGSREADPGDAYKEVAAAFVNHGVREVEGSKHAERNLYEHGADIATIAGTKVRCESCNGHLGASEVYANSSAGDRAGRARTGAMFRGTELYSPTHPGVPGSVQLADADTQEGMTRARSLSPAPRIRRQGVETDGK